MPAYNLNVFLSKLLNGAHSCPMPTVLLDDPYETLKFNLPPDWPALFVDLLLTNSPEQFGFDFDSALVKMEALLS